MISFHTAASTSTLMSPPAPVVAYATLPLPDKTTAVSFTVASVTALRPEPSVLTTYNLPACTYATRWPSSLMLNVSAPPLASSTSVRDRTSRATSLGWMISESVDANAVA